MHSQVEMLALQPTEALQARYNALQDAYWKTNDLATLKSILAEEDPISNELIRRDIAQIRENTIELQEGYPCLVVDAITAAAQAQVKWCHHTFRDWLLRYHEPDWCWK
jgi:hypothetical protein